MNIEDTIQDRLETPDSAVMEKARAEIIRLRSELKYSRSLLLEAFNTVDNNLSVEWLNKVDKLLV